MTKIIDTAFLYPATPTAAPAQHQPTGRVSPSVFTVLNTAPGGQRSLGDRAGWRGMRGMRSQPQVCQIFSITSGWSIKAMIRIAPPHRTHNSGSAAYTFLINSAQRCLKSDEPGGGGISTEPVGGEARVSSPTSRVC